MNFKHQFSAGLQLLVAMNMAAVLMVACGGGGSSRSSTPIENVSRSGTGTLTAIPTSPTPGNVLPITIDAGPVTGASEINIAYVSVTICTPGTSGTTAACQTIGHVMLDTGSSGLRILNSALSPNLSLQPVTDSNGRAIGECMGFADGVSWGSVQIADVYLGGEVAPSLPIQIIGDKPAGVSGVPLDCSGTSTVEDNLASLGANGILGVGLFVNDCDICSSPVVPPMYYTCTSNCTSSGVTSAQLVKNPVALFPQDNNGVLIQLPVVSATGATSLTGSLIFGIGTGTWTNNALGSATVYPTDPYGNFRTTYKNTLMTGSYIDSGSNALFFNDSIATCSITTWTYCPSLPPTSSSPLTLIAANAAASGSPSGTVNFSIVGVDPLGASIVAANIGGPYGGSNPQFAWGMPFFFGRSVFTAISGMNTPGGYGPYFAY